MNPRYGYIEKILAGLKTIESRWYQTRRDPWNKVKVGDTVYFKDSGCPVVARAQVSEVLQFENPSVAEMKSLVSQFGRQITGGSLDFDSFYKSIADKHYVILISLTSPKSISPFCINKTGFGTGCAWMCTPNIDRLKLPLPIHR